MSKHLRRANAGHLLRTPGGHLVNDCHEDGGLTCEDARCAFHASAYTVLGVGGLVGCSECEPGVDSPWDGVLERVDLICNWMLNTPASVGGRIPSYALAAASNCDNDLNGVGIWFNYLHCRWDLAITCVRNSGGRLDYFPIWNGTKPLGTSPAGIYTRDCGCDLTPTLTVV